MNRLSVIITLFFSISFFSCKKGGASEDGNILIINRDTNKLVLLTESDKRPSFHFTPAKNWMNDPNGLVFYKGVYHLFFQYNPNSNVWGPMNWGHTSSTDLFNWQDFPIALIPDNLGTIFSGSAVVDSQNTSGFKAGNEDPVVAIFTHAGSQQMQSIAYSNDGGNTWNKYSSNPVLSNPGLADFRDPKVFWYEPGKKWILVLAAGDRIKIYSSSNLKNWSFESDFGSSFGAHSGVWECPDLFPLTIEGTTTTKWVLLVSLNGGPNGGTATQYFVGDFDGKNFSIASNITSWMDYGTDNYAGVTYNNIPTSDSRRILIGWMSNWSYAQNVPTTTWRSTMTVPRNLSLESTGSGYLLKSIPVSELNNYLNKSLDTVISGPFSKVNLTDNKIIKTGSYQILFSADLSLNNSIQFSVGNSSENISFNYDPSAGFIALDRSVSGNVEFNNLMKQKIYCPFVPKKGQLTEFRLLIDKTSLELFVESGSKVLTTLFFPNYQYNQLKLESNNSASIFSNFKLTGINKSLLR